MLWARKNITNEAVKRYIKLVVLEQEILKEKEELSKTLTKEEIEAISNYFHIHKYFSVREVSKLLGISLQEVRRHCANKVYEGYQKSGENGTWYIESRQFITHPNWAVFISKREADFKRSRKIAELVLELNKEED